MDKKQRDLNMEYAITRGSLIQQLTKEERKQALIKQKEKGYLSNKELELLHQKECINNE